jgi:hypothetical protein
MRGHRDPDEVSAARSDRARGPHRREEPRPLPNDWTPSLMLAAEVKDRGFDLGPVVALYREAQAGRLLKRWTDASFRRWFDEAELGGALRGCSTRR